MILGVGEAAFAAAFHLTAHSLRAGEAEARRRNAPVVLTANDGFADHHLVIAQLGIAFGVDAPRPARALLAAEAAELDEMSAGLILRRDGVRRRRCGVAAR